jgi:hypothetical protein
MLYTPLHIGGIGKRGCSWDGHAIAVPLLAEPVGAIERDGHRIAAIHGPGGVEADQGRVDDIHGEGGHGVGRGTVGIVQHHAHRFVACGGIGMGGVGGGESTAQAAIAPGDDQGVHGDARKVDAELLHECADVSSTWGKYGWHDHAPEGARKRAKPRPEIAAAVVMDEQIIQVGAQETTTPRYNAPTISLVVDVETVAGT